MFQHTAQFQKWCWRTWSRLDLVMTFASWRSIRIYQGLRSWWVGRACDAKSVPSKGLSASCRTNQWNVCNANDLTPTRRSLIYWVKFFYFFSLILCKVFNLSLGLVTSYRCLCLQHLIERNNHMHTLWRHQSSPIAILCGSSSIWHRNPLHCFVPNPSSDQNPSCHWYGTVPICVHGYCHHLVVLFPSQRCHRRGQIGTHQSPYCNNHNAFADRRRGVWILW